MAETWAIDNPDGQSGIDNGKDIDNRPLPICTPFSAAIG